MKNDDDALRAQDPPVDLGRLLRGIRGDQALLGQLLDTFRRDCPARLEAVEEALRSLDPGALARAAHALRGSLVILGAAAACEAAAELEGLALEGNLAEAPAPAARLKAEVSRVLRHLDERPRAT